MVNDWVQTVWTTMKIGVDPDSGHLKASDLRARFKCRTKSKGDWIDPETAVWCIVETNNKASEQFISMFLRKMIQVYDLAINLIEENSIEAGNLCPIRLFEINGTQWYRATDICRAARCQLAQSVKSNRCVSFNDLRIQQLTRKCVLITNGWIHPHTLYVSRDGLVELIKQSKTASSINVAQVLGIDVTGKELSIEAQVTLQLDSYCRTKGIKFVHQFYVRSIKDQRYFIDYYLPEYKIAIEIDENAHKNRDPEYESKREINIGRILGCSFIRCNPSDPAFSFEELTQIIDKATKSSSRRRQAIVYVPSN